MADAHARLLNEIEIARIKVRCLTERGDVSEFLTSTAPPAAFGGKIDDRISFGQIMEHEQRAFAPGLRPKGS